MRHSSKITIVLAFLAHGLFAQEILDQKDNVIVVRVPLDENGKELANKAQITSVKEDTELETIAEGGWDKEKTLHEDIKDSDEDKNILENSEALRGFHVGFGRTPFGRYRYRSIGNHSTLHYRNYAWRPYRFRAFRGYNQYYYSPRTQVYYYPGFYNRGAYNLAYQAPYSGFYGYPAYTNYGNYGSGYYTGSYYQSFNYNYNYGY